MPWARLGDTAATYPKLLMIAGLPGADARAVNEVRGWLLGCATQSAAHTTDYVIDLGTAALFGGSRTQKLIAWCVRTGLLTPVDVDGIEHWAIIADPDFIHIRTKAELQWEKERREDTQGPLAIEVRVRDGDNCRYCGIQVHWTGPKNNKAAEYDHRVPGQRARRAADMVIACRRCNGSRQDSGPDWDETHPLRPVPTRPHYSQHTVSFLARNGHDDLRPNLEPDATTSSSRRAADRAQDADDTAATTARPVDEPAADRARPAAQHQPHTEPEATETPQPQAQSLPGDRTESETPARESSESPGRVGSGRAGTDRGGTARDGKRRGSRGGKGRKPRPPGAPQHQQTQAGERP